MIRFRAADAVQSLSIKQRKCIFKNEMIGANAVNHIVGDTATRC